MELKHFRDKQWKVMSQQVESWFFFVEEFSNEFIEVLVILGLIKGNCEDIGICGMLLDSFGGNSSLNMIVLVILF